jgi:hypothetical protein
VYPYYRRLVVNSIRSDVHAGLAAMLRRSIWMLNNRLFDGGIPMSINEVKKKEWIQQKHPVSTHEVAAWLTKYVFTIEKHYGNAQDLPYDDSLDRTTFLARK